MEQFCSVVNRTFMFRDIFVKSHKKGGHKMFIYTRIKDLREDNDLYQKEIAAILNTTREQYSRWERGAQEIPLHHAITLARYYKVSLDYLTGLTNNKRGGK